MKFCTLALVSLFSVASVEGQQSTCSGQNNRWPAPDDTGYSFTWTKDTNIRYPEMFEGKFSNVLTYKCDGMGTNGKRVIISNNIPDHDVIVHRNVSPVEVLSVVEIPLDPEVPVANADSDKAEIPIRGMVAIAKNGVPTFGSQESDGLNAVEPTASNKLDATYWYGHPGAGNHGWHVHNPHMGMEEVSEDTFLGWAMDGYKIYGPVTGDKAFADDALDVCNGRVNADGEYVYHVRSFEQVDENLEYCDGTSPVTRWNYIFGCYSGDVSETRVVGQTGYALHESCQLESRGACTDNPDYFLAGEETQNCEWVQEDSESRCLLDNIENECPSTCGNLDCANTNNDAGDDNSDNDSDDTPKTPLNPTNRPNVIIIQPDDLVFMDDWGRPPYDGGPNDMPGYGDDIPFMEGLRNDGLQMTQAYTASPMCGTSRYSTITGKMPSRAASIRRGYDRAIDGFPAAITIPTTKLIDHGGQDDCTVENMAAQFADDLEYKTAMIGKWHLSRIRDVDYTYEHAKSEVQKCGFDHVGGLYIENLASSPDEFDNYSDGSFSHNMEWITYEAIKFINETTSDGDNFFMYFNPTVPHASNSVEDALNSNLFSCKATADPDFDWPEDKEPWIKGMSEDEGCEEYRNTVTDRANGNVKNLGPIWLDDAIGALIEALKDNNIYEDTIIVFQEDHGMDTKGGLYEGGVRIPQFVHYPAGIHPGKFDAPVSTVDLAPTLLEYAKIEPSYYTDGTSWKEAVADAAIEESWRTDRCLLYEMDQDRAIRCGCYKYMDIFDTNSGTYNSGENNGFANSLGGMMFDLCDGDDYPEAYATDSNNIREKLPVTITEELDQKQTSLVDILECHIENTDPELTADYSPCYGDTWAPSASPTNSPSESPSKAPTASPIACEDDAAYTFGNLDRNCSWLSGRDDVQKADICLRRDNGMTVADYCRAACNVC